MCDRWECCTLALVMLMDVLSASCFQPGLDAMNSAMHGLITITVTRVRWPSVRRSVFVAGLLFTGLILVTMHRALLDRTTPHLRHLPSQRVLLWVGNIVVGIVIIEKRSILDLELRGVRKSSQLCA